MIQHAYIDYTKATKAALSDYPRMAAILATADERAEAIEARLQRPAAPRQEPVPASGDGCSWDAAFDEMDALQARRSKAEEYMRWFLPAWECLTERERIVLEEHYINIAAHFDGGEWTDGVKNRINIERTAAYETSKSAVAKLSRFLAWPGNPLI